MSSQQYQYSFERSRRTVEDDDYLDSFPPGYRFCPTDSELVMDYLQNKVMNRPLPRNKIADVNLYASDPDTLTAQYEKWGEKEWYFFTPRDKKYPNGNRPRRDAGNGFWKATGADKPVLHENRRVGSRKALVFYVGHPPNGRKTNWIMHEFRVVGAPQSNRSTNDMRLDDWVLCRIYLKAEQPNRALPAPAVNSSPPAASPVTPAPVVNYPPALPVARPAFPVARPAPPFNYPHALPMGQVNYPPSSLIARPRLAPLVAHPVPPFNYPPPMALPDPLAPPPAAPFIACSVPPTSSIGAFGNYNSTENGSFWNSGTQNGSFWNDGAENDAAENDGAEYTRFLNDEPLLKEVAFWNIVVGNNGDENGASWDVEVAHPVSNPGAFWKSTPPLDPGTESTPPPDPGVGTECTPPPHRGAFPLDDIIRLPESVKRQKLLTQPQQLKTSKQPDDLRKSREDPCVDHDEKRRRSTAQSQSR